MIEIGKEKIVIKKNAQEILKKLMKYVNVLKDGLVKTVLKKLIYALMLIVQEMEYVEKENVIVNGLLLVMIVQLNNASKIVQIMVNVLKENVNVMKALVENSVIFKNV